MAAKLVYDAVATIGKYTDKQGNEKKRYLSVGKVFESEGGGLSLKLDSVPVTPEWSGWISFYVPKDSKEQSPTQEQHNTKKADGFQPQAKGAFDDDQDIPFANPYRGKMLLCI